MRPLRRLDRRLASWATQQLRSPAARRVAAILAHTGDSVLCLVVGLAAWLGTRGLGPTLGRRLFTAALCSSLVSLALKSLFRRNRPTVERGNFYLALDRHSFPSGHATRSAGVIVALWPLLPGVVRGGLLLWSVILNACRIGLGLHFPSDVVAGLAIGSAIGLLLRRVGLC
ncbi:MAG: phosphatase PAP2 family protein [Anaerolineales bacterium]